MYNVYCICLRISLSASFMHARYCTQSYSVAWCWRLHVISRVDDVVQRPECCNQLVIAMFKRSVKNGGICRKNLFWGALYITLRPVDSHYTKYSFTVAKQPSPAFSVVGDLRSTTSHIMRLFRSMTSRSKFNRTVFVPTVWQFLRAVCVTFATVPTLFATLKS